MRLVWVVIPLVLIVSMIGIVGVQESFADDVLMDFNEWQNDLNRFVTLSDTKISLSNYNSENNNVISELGNSFYWPKFNMTFPEQVKIGESFDVVLDYTYVIPDEDTRNYADPEEICPPVYCERQNIWIVIPTYVDYLNDDRIYESTPSDPRHTPIRTWNLYSLDPPFDNTKPLQETFTFVINKPDIDYPYGFIDISFHGDREAIFYFNAAQDGIVYFDDKEMQSIGDGPGQLKDKPISSIITTREERLAAGPVDGPPKEIWDQFKDYLIEQHSGEDIREMLLDSNIKLSWINSFLKFYPELDVQSFSPKKDLIVVGFLDEQIDGEESEFIASPRQQLEDGVTPEDIQCKENRVLVLRTNGNVACVTEKTADRTGWEIIETFNVQNISVIPEKTIEIIPKEKTSWISSATDLSYMDLEKIPNPEGYWVPLDDKDAFVNALVNATGDKLTNENKFGDADYFTENGKIVISPVYLSNYVISSVYYQMYDSFSLVSESDQLPFINNFMNSMGFKLNHNELSLTQEFLENCEGEYLTSCTIGNGTIFKFVDHGNISYKLASPYSEIKFRFYEHSHIMQERAGISIEFNGWTNNSELVQHPLGEQAANDIVREFILSTEYFSKSSSDGGTCEAELNESFPITPIVIAGVPFYNSAMADCSIFLDNTGTKDWPVVLVDGWTGEYVFRSYHGGQD